VLGELRRRGLPLPDAKVIYNAIDLQQFSPAAESPQDHIGQSVVQKQHPLRLLFAGSLTPQKGVDVAVKTMAALATSYGPERVTLTIAGTGPPEFDAQLRDFIRSHHLAKYITFTGWISRNNMPHLFRQHDVLLFTSSWQEPLARTMMEGMACGLALVSTLTGGTGEVIVPGINALTFTVGDAADLATQIESLLQDPSLLANLRLAARETARRRFGFERMVSEIEGFLRELI
jgi:glycosyltransferase involved in cell wall biosynthesis